MGHATVDAFIALHLFGVCGFILIILLTELLERENARHPAWWSFCVSWIVFGVSFSILFLAGMQFSPHLNQALCTVQTGLIYAAPPLVAHTTLALIFQLRAVMRYTLQKTDKQLSEKMRIGLAVGPWIVWALTVLVILVYGFRNPQHIKMNDQGTFCHLDSTVTSKVLASWLLLVALVIFAIEISLVIIMYQLGFLLSASCYACRTTVRLGIFLLQAIACFGVALATIISNDKSSVSDVLIAIQPATAAIVFGTKVRLPRIWLQKQEEPRGNVEVSSSSLDSVFFVDCTPSQRTSRDLTRTDSYLQKAVSGVSLPSSDV